MMCEAAGPEVIERVTIDRVAAPDLQVGDRFVFEVMTLSVIAKRQRTVFAVIDEPHLMFGRVHYKGGSEQVGEIQWTTGSPERAPVVWRIAAHRKREA